MVFDVVLGLLLIELMLHTMSHLTFPHMGLVSECLGFMRALLALLQNVQVTEISPPPVITLLPKSLPMGSVGDRP